MQNKKMEILTAAALTAGIPGMVAAAVAVKAMEAKAADTCAAADAAEMKKEG